MRIGLHHYKCVEEGEALFSIVREMVGRIAFPSRHRVRFQPRASQWSVHLIRHKRKTTYIMDGGGFAVTVATVSEHSFDAKKDEAVEFDMRMEAKETHTEVEVSKELLKSIYIQCSQNVLLSTAAQLGLGVCLWSRCRFLC